MIRYLMHQANCCADIVGWGDEGGCLRRYGAWVVRRFKRPCMNEKSQRQRWLSYLCNLISEIRVADISSKQRTQPVGTKDMLEVHSNANQKARSARFHVEGIAARCLFNSVARTRLEFTENIEVISNGRRVEESFCADAVRITILGVTFAISIHLH